MIINEDKLKNCDAMICNLALVLESKYNEIKITSGYRSPEYNAKVGGAKRSQHVLGKAIDVIVKDVSPIKVAAFVLDNVPAVNGFGIDVYKGYVHLDCREGKKTYWVYGRNGKTA